jgi:hypothetical protein
LNQFYSGRHWSKRHKLVDDYYWIIKSQTKKFFEKTGTYEVDYEFGFKKNPLDASNTTAMVKLIEDVLFENDGYKIVKKITISSNKSKEDYVKILITCL